VAARPARADAGQVRITPRNVEVMSFMVDIGLLPLEEG
jgi:hypothetical protein